VVGGVLVRQLNPIGEFLHPRLATCERLKQGDPVRLGDGQQVLGSLLDEPFGSGSRREPAAVSGPPRPYIPNSAEEREPSRMRPGPPVLPVPDGADSPLSGEGSGDAVPAGGASLGTSEVAGSMGSGGGG
jgi:hypothetical protein